MINNIQDNAFPMQLDIQIAYGLSTNPDLNIGRRTFDICYDLDKVFDVAYYKNGKSYKNHVRKYLDYFEKNNFCIKELQNISDAYQLWEVFNEWNERKIQADIENPNHYREHSEKYKGCLEKCVNGELKNSRIYGMFDSEDHLISYQLATLKNRAWVFGVTTACRKTEYAHIANVATVNFLHFFKQEGYLYCNWGECGGDKNLIAYKEAYPSFRIYYGKPEFQIERSTEKDIEEIISLMKATSTVEVPFPTEYMPDSIEAGNVWKAVANSRVVGIVECRFVDCRYFMTNLIVDPEYRAQGIATALLERLSKDIGSDFEFECYKINAKANSFYCGLRNTVRVGETKNDIGESWRYRKIFL